MKSYLATLLMIMAIEGLAAPLQLINEDEAKLNPINANSASRAITRGPLIRLISPSQVSRPFLFKVIFESRGDAKINRNTVKVEYLKGIGIDLTDRMRSAIMPSGIEILEAQAPIGVHPIRVSVTDAEGRLGMTEFNLIVK